MRSNFKSHYEKNGVITEMTIASTNKTTMTFEIILLVFLEEKFIILTTSFLHIFYQSAMCAHYKYKQIGADNLCIFFYHLL